MKIGISSLVLILSDECLIKNRNETRPHGLNVPDVRRMYVDDGMGRLLPSDVA